MTRVLGNAYVRPLVTISILLACLFVIAPVDGTPRGESQSYIRSHKNEEELLGYLRPILRSSGLAARVYFSGYCPPEPGDPVVFPKLNVLPPAESASGMAAAQQVFRKARGVSVTTDVNGIIRITIGKVSKNILKTRISKLTFDPRSQYTDIFAIQAIQGAQEVQSAMGRLRLRLSTKPTIAGVNPPLEGLPHIPAFMSDVSMDQALDYVASAFHSIVFFGACVNSNLYEIRSKALL